jgi:hypothetical protein
VIKIAKKFKFVGVGSNKRVNSSSRGRSMGGRKIRPGRGRSLMISATPTILMAGSMIDNEGNEVVQVTPVGIGLVKSFNGSFGGLGTSSADLREVIALTLEIREDEDLWDEELRQQILTEMRQPSAVS